MSENIELVSSAVARFEEILSDKAASKKFLVWNEFFTDENYSQVVGTEEFIDKVKPIISKPCLSFECAQMLAERFAGAKEVFDEKKKAYFVDFSPEENEVKRRKQKVSRDRPSFPIVSWTWRFALIFIIMIFFYLFIIGNYQAKRDEVNSQVKISVVTSTTTSRTYDGYQTKPYGSETTRTTAAYYNFLVDTSMYSEVQIILDKAYGKNIEEMTFGEDELYKLGEGSWVFTTEDKRMGYLTLDKDKKFELIIKDTVNAKGKVKVIYPEKGTNVIFEFDADGEKYYLGVEIDKYGIFRGAILMTDRTVISATKLLNEDQY
ncbi:MAG: hypothetical protein IJP10_02095 [Clostridia bacterium]|nr:hypothetical protein [Clostridia bacterium]